MDGGSDMSENEEIPVKVQHTKRALFKEQSRVTGVEYGYEESEAITQLPKLFSKQAFRITHLHLSPDIKEGINSYNDLVWGKDKQSITSDNNGTIVLQSKRGAKIIQSVAIAEVIDQSIVGVFRDEELTSQEAKQLRTAQKLLAKSIKRGNVEVETQHIVTAFKEASVESRKTRL